MQGNASRSSGEIHDEGVSFARRDDKKGLNVTSAAVFIVGEMAGSGVLALPKAIVSSGKLSNGNLIVSLSHNTH